MRFTIRDSLWLTVVVALGVVFVIVGPDRASAADSPLIAELRNMPSRCRCFSPDGKKLAIGGAIDAIAAVELVECETWKPIASLRLGAGSVLALAFTTDGKRLCVALGNDVVALSISDGSELGRLSRHTELVFAIAVSGNGRYLATAGEDGRVCLWDAAKLTFVRELSHTVNSIFDVAFDETGAQVAAVGSDIFRVWPTVDKVDSRDVPIDDSAHDVRFSPDGKIIVAGTISGNVIVVSAEDLTSPPQIHRLGRSISGISFVSSNDFFVAGIDRSVRAISIESGRVVGRPYSGGARVDGIAFTGVTKQLAIGFWNGSVRIVNVDQVVLPRD
jgi:WD40 repeat protein